MLHVFRATHLDREYGDPTYGGVTANHDKLIVIGTQRHGQPMQVLAPENQDYEVSDSAPGAVLLENESPELYGPVLIPLDFVDTENPGKFKVPKWFVGPVGGGNFAGTGDSRWASLGDTVGAGRHLDVVPVYDRIENMWKYQISTTGQANILGFWDYDREATLKCPSCGWSGCGAGHEDFFQDLLDVRCPDCEDMILIVNYPTLVETQVAAKAGDQRAQAELPKIEAAEARAQRAVASELREAAQLPDLEGDRIVIEWDFDQRDDDAWTILRRDDQEIWRESAYYEGYRRFAEVFHILRDRYGSRLAEVRPTPASKLYLYGDKLSAPETVASLNASLTQKTEPPRA